MVTVESTRRKYKKLLELHMKVPQKALRLIFFSRPDSWSFISLIDTKYELLNLTHHPLKLTLELFTIATDK